MRHKGKDTEAKTQRHRHSSGGGWRAAKEVPKDSEVGPVVVVAGGRRQKHQGFRGGTGSGDGGGGRAATEAPKVLRLDR